MLIRLMVAAASSGFAGTRACAAGGRRTRSRCSLRHLAADGPGAASYPLPMVVVALIPILGGLLVGLGGYLGWSGRLHRDRAAGVRTPATMRSDEAFALGNRVAGVPTMAAGLVAVLAGLAALTMPTAFGTIIAAVIGVVGMLALLAAGGVLGHRAALAVPAATAAEAGGCGGCACGAGGCGSAAE